MKLNGSTAVNFSALDAEFSALQSSSAELRTQLETLQPDISALKNIRKYIDMVLNKQQLSAPGGKTPEKESVLKKLEQLQQKIQRSVSTINRKSGLKWGVLEKISTLKMRLYSLANENSQKPTKTNYVFLPLIATAYR